MDIEQLHALEAVLGRNFDNPDLLREALSHSSQADHRLESNERLEFLGDSVLSLVICRTLFERFPRYLEGDLTKIKSMLVSRKTCARLATDLSLPEYTRVGKGMNHTRAMSGSIAAGTFEAVVAAIYLDGGYDAAAEFIVRVYGDLIEEADAEQHQENFKSVLQQYSQHQHGETPYYELLDEKGPDHNKAFEVGVVIGERRFQTAWGVTKKEAEQKAARQALLELGLLESDPE